MTTTTTTSTTSVAHILALPNGLTRHSPTVVYIGRANGRHRLKASKWANPFRVGIDGDRAEVITKYRRWLYSPGQTWLWGHLPELRGKVLACWCAPEACHGQVLREALDELFPGEYAGVTA